MAELPPNQLSILDHTLHRAANGMYCGDSDDMAELVAAGLMKFASRVKWCPDSYFRITDAGCKAWRDAQPEPPKITARKRRAQARYRAYLRVADLMSFGEYLRIEGGA